MKNELVSIIGCVAEPALSSNIEWAEEAFKSPSEVQIKYRVDDGVDGRVDVAEPCDRLGHLWMQTARRTERHDHVHQEEWKPQTNTFNHNHCLLKRHNFPPKLTNLSSVCKKHSHQLPHWRSCYRTFPKTCAMMDQKCARVTSRERKHP